MCYYDKEQWHIICRKFLGLGFDVRNLTPTLFNVYPYGTKKCLKIQKATRKHEITFSNILRFQGVNLVQPTKMD